MKKLRILFLLVFLPLEAVVAQCNGSNQLCNRPYNEIAYLTTHNAFNCSQEGFNLPNQTGNLTTQLNYGVRALMLDVYDVAGVPTVYHGFILLGSQPLSSNLNEIKSFLDTNPNEVVSIIFECNTSANAIEAVFSQTGLLSYLYEHPNNATWPTLQQLITAGQRLVIFSDVNDASASQGWYHYLWNEAVETPFSINDTADFTCEFNRGDSLNDLFILNHFVTDATLGTGSQAAAQVANANPFFLQRVLNCQQSLNKFPNFVTVDFYDLGNAMEVVNTLNGIGLNSPGENLSSIEPLIVYPNPSQSGFSLRIPKEFQKPFSVEIQNMLGEFVYRAQGLHQTEIIFPCSGYSNGIYFIKLKNEKGATLGGKVQLQ